MTMTHFTLASRPAVIFRTVCQFDAASIIPSVTGITLDGRRQTTVPITDVAPVAPHRASIALRELAASASIEAALAKIAPRLTAPTDKADKPLVRHQLHEGTVAPLEAAVARLGMQMPDPPQLFGAARR